MKKSWKIKSGWTKISCSVIDEAGLVNRVEYFVNKQLPGNESLTMSQSIAKATVIYKDQLFFRCDEGEWVRCEPGRMHVSAYWAFGDEFPLEPNGWEVPAEY